jgi:hypothetical protein
MLIGFGYVTIELQFLDLCCARRARFSSLRLPMEGWSAERGLISCTALPASLDEKCLRKKGKNRVNLKEKTDRLYLHHM